MGKTMSTYQNSTFTGGLFLIEVTGVWVFSNYAAQPQMASLSKASGITGATVNAEAGQPVTVTMPAPAAAAVQHLLLPHRPPSNDSPTVADVIFICCDTAINLASNVFPPPWSWLIKGGWWFIKQVTGLTGNDGEVTFYVYPSLEAAQTNKPCISDSGVSNSPANLGELTLTQVNAPSTGAVVTVRDNAMQGLHGASTFRLLATVEPGLFFTSGQLLTRGGYYGRASAGEGAAHMSLRFSYGGQPLSMPVNGYWIINDMAVLTPDMRQAALTFAPLEATYHIGSTPEKLIPVDLFAWYEADDIHTGVASFTTMALVRTRIEIQRGTLNLQGRVFYPQMQPVGTGPRPNYTLATPLSVDAVERLRVAPGTYLLLAGTAEQHGAINAPWGALDFPTASLGAGGVIGAGAADNTPYFPTEQHQIAITMHGANFQLAQETNAEVLRKRREGLAAGGFDQAAWLFSVLCATRPALARRFATERQRWAALDPDGATARARAATLPPDFPDLMDELSDYLASGASLEDFAMPEST